MTITFLDWAVLVVYFIVITGIGLIVGYRVRRSGEYFLGDRKFGPWLMIGQSFSVGTHAEMPVALAGAVYSVGASAIWYQWKNLFITPLYWIMAPVFRRIRRTTMAEFTEDRYGRFMGAIYIVFAVCFFIIETGGLLKGAGKVIGQATGARKLAAAPGSAPCKVAAVVRMIKKATMFDNAMPTRVSNAMRRNCLRA